jgi:hypothetical protein
MRCRIVDGVTRSADPPEAAYKIVSARFPRELIERVEAHARGTDRSFSAVLREAVRTHVPPTTADAVALTDNGGSAP